MGLADTLFESAKTALNTGVEVAFFWQLVSFINRPCNSILQANSKTEIMALVHNTDTALTAPRDLDNRQSI